MRLLPLIFDLALVALVIWAGWFQVLKPLKNGTKIFPMLRTQRREVEKEVTDKREKDEIREIRDTLTQSSTKKRKS